MQQGQLSERASESWGNSGGEVIAEDLDAYASKRKAIDKSPIHPTHSNVERLPCTFHHRPPPSSPPPQVKSKFFKMVPVPQQGPASCLSPSPHLLPLSSSFIPCQLA